MTSLTGMCTPVFPSIDDIYCTSVPHNGDNDKVSAIKHKTDRSIEKGNTVKKRKK